MTTTNNMDYLNKYLTDPLETLTFRAPKHVATIRLCGGALTFDINDNMSFVMPTEEQRKNLKEMLCIEVIPAEEDDCAR